MQVYGQGMSVAAMEAEALRSMLQVCQSAMEMPDCNEICVPSWAFLDKSYLAITPAHVQFSPITEPLQERAPLGRLTRNLVPELAAALQQAVGQIVVFPYQAATGVHPSPNASSSCHH